MTAFSVAIVFFFFGMFVFTAFFRTAVFLSRSNFCLMTIIACVRARTQKEAERKEKHEYVDFSRQGNCFSNTNLTKNVRGYCFLRFQ